MGESTLASEGCRVIRVTINDDFTSASRLQKALDGITGPQDGVWMSAPCVGGCAYNEQNWLIGEKTCEKIWQHWIIYIAIKRNMYILFQHCHKVGAMIFNEWPKSCDYWNDPDIQWFMQLFNLKFTEFHGCQFGLTAINPVFYGMLINKPWFGACNDEQICHGMQRICKGNHKHAPCATVDTRRTECYTRELVAHFHMLFAKRVQGLLQPTSRRSHCAIACCAPCTMSAYKGTPAKGASSAKATGSYGPPRQRSPGPGYPDLVTSASSSTSSNPPKSKAGGSF